MRIEALRNSRPSRAGNSPEFQAELSSPSTGRMKGWSEDCLGEFGPPGFVAIGLFGAAGRFGTAGCCGTAGFNAKGRSASLLVADFSSFPAIL